jgi:hypothetical protein
MNRLILFSSLLVACGCSGPSFQEGWARVEVGDAGTVDAQPLGSGGATGAGGYPTGSGGSGVVRATGGAGSGGIPAAGGMVGSTGGAAAGGMTATGGAQATAGGAMSTGGALGAGGMSGTGGVIGSGGVVACTLVTHSNGIGQTWQDCVPLGTYNESQAMKACEASGAPLCTMTGGCGTTSYAVCGYDTPGMQQHGGCWEYGSGLITAYVSSTACPGVNDPAARLWK